MQPTFFNVVFVISHLYDLSIDGTRKHQESAQAFSHDVSNKMDYYLNQGVKLQDAKIMASLSFFLRNNLILAKIDKDLDENQDDMHSMFHYKINGDGRVIELHIHQTETIYLTLFPKIICSLDRLEVIRFPNNCIETIPECITNLKKLKVLDVSNLYAPNPLIPESIDSFIASLEMFNTFYDE